MDLSQDASRLRLRERRSDAFGGDHKSREHNAGDADARNPENDGVGSLCLGNVRILIRFADGNLMRTHISD